MWIIGNLNLNIIGSILNHCTKTFCASNKFRFELYGKFSWLPYSEYQENIKNSIEDMFPISKNLNSLVSIPHFFAF